MKRQLRIICLAGFMTTAPVYATENTPVLNTSCNTAPFIRQQPQVNISQLLANTHHSNLSHRLDSAKALGWIPEPFTLNRCGGYFADIAQVGSTPKLLPMKIAPVTISADSSQLQYSGTSTLSGNVVITQPGRFIRADEMHVDTNNGDYQKADLQGNIFIQEPGKVALAQTAQLDLKHQTYRLNDVIYRLFLGNHLTSSSAAPSNQTDETNPNNHALLSGWGKASSVLQPPTGITQLHHVSYSTCPPHSRAWDLEAEQIDLDQTTGRGHAYNAVLYAQHIPILYTPYINFPIDNRRQTGFLYPQFIFGGNSGFGFGAPFYWNIAPNYDDTFTPYFYSRRGVQLNNLFRYLTPDSSGALSAGFLPNDWEFRQFRTTEPNEVPNGTPGLNDLENATSTRNYVSWSDKTQLSDHWLGTVNYTRVSDDYYLQDLGGVPIAAQNQLLQQGQVAYTTDTWNFLGNLQSYQTLHPVNQAVVLNQYSMLPQLRFASHLPETANTFNYQWTTEFVNFIEAPNPGQSNTPPSGERLHITPEVSLPLANAAGYITPSLHYDLTQYNLGDQPQEYPDEITRTLPLFNIDSGLFFIRNTHLFSSNYQQTLEPRLFYLYVPYRNQSDIPIFDSALQPFTYHQLFMLNRFTGSDRIGDANQVSVALSTRFTNQQTGEEKFNTGIGIIRYFQNRQVTCNGINCVDSPYALGSTSLTESTSPVVGQATYHFNPDWSSSVDAAWDPHNRQTQNASFNFQYMPLPNHVINVGYSFVRFGDLFEIPSDTHNSLSTNTTNAQYNLSEPTASFAWPLNDRWSVLGSWGYSWNRNNTLTYFSGLQYNSCCWAIQTVLARSFSGINALGTPQYSNGVYVQWAFKGLAKVAANDPTSLLTSSIPGYRPNFAE